ncbi:hypothetical protein E3Q06_01912 [Wallemia mellicola]|uniref:Mitochondrial phosphate carrier protein n=1 Tax=Wallemia mellicola TaxID=1708541 RepID=A0AB38MYG5_9BASI|nr:hypothetical protein E3Q21_02003 [Wallemia mellicola]TIB88614.1 hypothetical protein E3Q20_01996 [Wallemia mellicola]TIC18082.1 hypothetical protein E3Q13_02179 [Wallemia mellicola]TIC23910.1 hypothetical protein E3Q12_01783 [Wallemia mellicola]TIC28650.1 hypothetical protein E3Q11_01798 [Wallemia mellicola]
MVEATKPQTPQGADLLGRYALVFLSSLTAAKCAITHGGATPIDVVKTRIQLEPETYRGGMLKSFRQIASTEGPGALLTGAGPTFAGYFLQGAFKFGGYEFFKKQAVDYVGLENAKDNRTAIYLGSSALAEFFADIALCPLEATRIRLVSNPQFASGLVSGFTKIVGQEGVGALYAGFGPICFKQIPYTMAKFAVYETVSEQAIHAYGKPKSELSGAEANTINLGCGLIAGMASAVISQPADTLLSKINKTEAKAGESTTQRLAGLAKQLGVGGMFSGIGTRLVMVGGITAGQFALYGSIKSSLNATGGTEIAK